MSGAKVVVNLAHGGGGSSWEAIEKALVGSARLVADACISASTERLVHVGSIAGLYLGNDGEVVTGATPPDPIDTKRGDYARAKAIADRMLMQMSGAGTLRVCILRPGLVVGEGTSPFHSGLGTFNNDQHCLGWNSGVNPLPFVLVDDVADAIARCITAPNVIGKAYNLVGPVRPSAREFISELAKASARPLRFHTSSVAKLFGAEFGKWLIKRAVGRRAPFPSVRDFRSRGLTASFDCSDAVRDFGWATTADRQAFFDGAFRGVRR